MYRLLLVSLLWSLSFPLFEAHLKGLEPNAAAAVRLLLALPLFLLFWRPGRISRHGAIGLLCLGGLQYGVMYACLNASYQFLQAWQVALFTIFTPIYVTLWHDARSGRFHLRALSLAVLAVLGAALIRQPGSSWGDFLTGLGLMQLSNLAFAIGQVEYRRWRQSRSTGETVDFAWLLLGGALVAAIPATLTGGWSTLVGLDGRGWLVLVYMGVVASGVAFYLWNSGAARTNAATLAVMNNAKVPLAVVVSLLLGQGLGSVEPWSASAGTFLLIAAGWLAQRSAKS